MKTVPKKTILLRNGLKEKDRIRQKIVNGPWYSTSSMNLKKYINRLYTYYKYTNVQK